MDQCRNRAEFSATIFWPQLFVPNFLGHLAGVLVPWEELTTRFCAKLFWGFLASIIWPQPAAEALDLNRQRGRCQSEMQSSFAGKVLMESESFAGVEAAAF